MAKYRSPFYSGELWKPVRGYEGLYEVSNKGRVRSLSRFKNNHSKKQYIGERILTNSPMTNGYLRVNLNKGGVPKHYFIHRLVAQHFLINPGNKRTINHRDGNPRNNDVSNLEWATDYENIHHAMDTGLMNYKGEGNPMSKLTGKDVRRIKMGLKMGIKQRELATIFNISQSLISTIGSERRWKHIKLNIV